MSEVKWIKIAVDIFDNRKIKQIEKLPEGDAIIVIWLQLLCLAGSINENGFIVMTKDIAYTDELLANAFNRSLTVIRLALDIFVKFGMIELIDDVICISNWEKYQNADKLLAIREYNRIAKQKEREKKRLSIGNVIDKSLTSQGQSIDCQDTDIDRDIELDKEIDKEKEIRDIVEYLNQEADTNYRPTSVKTRTLIKARMKEGFTVDNFHTVIQKKTAEWIGTEQEKYLRPETLFGTKFESYLNQKNGKPKSTFEILQAEYEKEVNNEQNRNHQITGSY